MIPAERQERAHTLCEALTREVASFIPHGITAWPGVWGIVDGPGAEFMEALSLWEQTETEEAKNRVRDAYDDVVAAWRRAAHAYNRTGAT